MKTLAILMTVFNRKKDTLRCLKCIYNQLPISECQVEIYLTNDGCTDGTPEAIMAQYPLIHIIKGDGNLYWNRGMYTAWKEAAKFDYDYYLWLNDDTYLFVDSILRMLQESEDVMDSAIIVGASRSEVFCSVTYGLHYVNGKLLIPNGDFQEGGNLQGNTVLVPKSIYKILGLLDFHYLHAGGDTDYGLRAKKKNIKLLLSKEYTGFCESHLSLSKWCNPDYSFTQRWKNLNSPIGMPLSILFYHEKKHYGIAMALFHCITTVTHCMFPSLWIKYNL